MSGQAIPQNRSPSSRWPARWRASTSVLRRVRVWRDQRGSIATTFGLAVVPLIMIAGAAVDLTRASSADARLQQAADAAILALGRNEKSTTDVNKLKQLATAQMATMLPENYDFEVTSVARDSGKLTLNAHGSIPAGVSGMMGIEDFDQSATSEVIWGATGQGGTVGKLEVALVLDNTGSMAQSSRMVEMKKAAKALLDELQASDPGLVKVGIVPFDTSVKIPTSYKTATWFKTAWWVNWLWTGCMADRDQPYDVGDQPVTTAEETKYPPALCDNNGLAAIQPLTATFADLYAKVNAMTPAGNTNITIGLSWGQTILSSREPFVQGAAAGTTGLRKIMVLMTDGANTQNRWTSEASAIDARTALACASVKSAGIELYTVRLIEGNARLLQDCASAGKFFNVEDIDDVVPTFRAIGQELSQLRLSR